MSKASGGQPSTIPLILLVKSLQQAMRFELEQRLRDVGLTVTQLAVLGTLNESPGASNAELARAAFVSPQSMGEVLNALDQAGLVERSAAPTNARILRSILTPKGRETAQRGVAIASAIENRLTKSMTAAECKTLQKLLGRCLQTLREPS